MISDGIGLPFKSVLRCHLQVLIKHVLNPRLFKNLYSVDKSHISIFEQAKEDISQRPDADPANA